MTTRISRLGIYIFCLIFIPCSTGLAQTKPGERRPALPFSPAIRVGDTLYLSGQIGLDPKTRKLASGIEAETKLAMRNLGRELKANGFRFSDVVATHVWMTDLSEIGPMSNAYRTSFEPGKMPTRTTVGIANLALGASIEITMVAVHGEKKYVYPEGAKPGKAPFSPGVLVGDRLFLSGQAGVIPGTIKLVQGDVKVHVNQTLKNIESVLKAADMDFSNVVSTEVFMTSGDYFGPMSEAYVARVRDPRPARVPVLVSAIPLNSPVEITMIASRNKKTPILPKGMQPSGAYSRGLRIGNGMYIAGVYSRKESPKERVDDCLARVKKILEAGGFRLSDVVEARVYLADMNDYAEMNAAYRTYFPQRPPTRATIGVSELPGRSGIGMSFVAKKASP